MPANIVVSNVPWFYFERLAVTRALIYGADIWCRVSRAAVKAWCCAKIQFHISKISQ